MRILIVKLSSMGDIVHTLPAVTDIAKNHPEVVFDWVVEEGFAEIPSWHPHVKTIIPIALRRWKKSIWRSLFRGEPFVFLRKLRAQRYDLIIDAQGLLKSALIARLAKGIVIGMNRHSARESLAPCLYHRSYDIPKNQHAITRTRQLFACALKKPYPETLPDSGLTFSSEPSAAPPYLFFLHGTSRAEKQWCVAAWRELAERAHQQGYQVKLTYGNASEKQNAEAIADQLPNVHVLPTMNLRSCTQVLLQATGMISVDTGLAHLAAALHLPNVTLYGPTSPAKTGTMGKHQIHLMLQDPLTKQPLSAQLVWQTLHELCI